MTRIAGAKSYRERPQYAPHPSRVVNLCALLLIFDIVAPIASPATEDEPPPPIIRDPELVEISGLAPSLKTDGVLWTHNDGGNAPFLFAIDGRAASLGKVELSGTTNRDWEDIESFTWNGRPYLLIADTGGNNGKRQSFRLILVEEPSLPPSGKVGKVTPVAILTFRYDGGPRDCESMAFDPVTGTVFLVSKEKDGGTLFLLPLGAQSRSGLVAKRAGKLQLPANIGNPENRSLLALAVCTFRLGKYATDKALSKFRDG